LFVSYCWLESLNHLQIDKTFSLLQLNKCLVIIQSYFLAEEENFAALPPGTTIIATKKF